MAYTGQQSFLLQAAQKYNLLGYKVGFAKGKEFLSEYEHKIPDNFDGISLIPEDMVCLDFDDPDFGLVWQHKPPTLKERTPRGWHLFYRLPIMPPNGPMTVYPPWIAKINWRPHVDILVKVRGSPTVNSDPFNRQVSRYGGTKGMVPSTKSEAPIWGEHILVSPTTGYKRIWPNECPPFNQLTEVPEWLRNVLLKP